MLKKKTKQKKIIAFDFFAMKLVCGRRGCGASGGGGGSGQRIASSNASQSQFYSQYSHFCMRTRSIREWAKEEAEEQRE